LPTLGRPTIPQQSDIPENFCSIVPLASPVSGAPMAECDIKYKAFSSNHNVWKKQIYFIK